MLQQYGATAADVLAVCPNGAVLVDPYRGGARRDASAWSTPRRMTSSSTSSWSAPARRALQPPCMRASEGLHVVVVDCRAYGGQAGASARIENYLGFPTGISGLALAGRAYVQAQKFGAEILIPAQAATLDCTNAGARRRIATDARRRSNASLAHRRHRERRAVPPTRRPATRRLRRPRRVVLGVTLEAKMCERSEVVLVGGGNSAGQAAVFLAGYASKVHMLVRGAGLASTMSRYLIDRIEATRAIELHSHTRLTRFTATQTEMWRRSPGATSETGSTSATTFAMSSCSWARIPRPAGSKAATSPAMRTDSY